MRLFSLALLVFTSIFTLSGQSTLGTITGIVTDQTSAAVVGATVEVRNTGTNARLEVRTGDLGRYTAPSLPAGTYSVTVSISGFKTAVVQGVEVRTATVTSQNVTLELGAVTESVNVTGEAPLITPDSAAVTTSITNKIIQDLPFVDRSMMQVVLLTPGAQGDPQYNGGVQSELPGIFTQPVTPGASISIGGGRPGSGSVLVDGSDVTSGGFARSVMTFSGDQVQEVTVQANGIPAQYGRTTTAIVNQSTKSGTNEFRGNASWAHMEPFLQTRALGAAFDPTNRYNSFAAAIGGPVVIPKVYDGRNKTFFWATGEPQRQSLLFGASRVRLPTAEELRGNFRNSWDFLDPTLRQQNVDAAIASGVRTNQLRWHYARNAQGFPIGPILPTAQRDVIPNNDLSYLLASNPIAQKVIPMLYPITPGVDNAYVRWLRPDGLWESDGNNAVFARGVSTVDNRWSTKIDQNFGAAGRLYGRFSSAPVTGTRFQFGGPGDPADPLPQDEIISRNAALGYTHILSPTLINETRITYSRANAIRGPNNAALSRDWGAELGLLSAITGQGFPRFSGVGRGFDGDGNSNGRSVDVNVGIGNDLSWVRGAHSFKMGGEHRRIQVNRLSYGGLAGGVYNFTGQITPNTGSINAIVNELGGLITGSLNTYNFKRQQTSAYYRWRYTAAYFQDDWKVSQKLTLNLGLRYDVETPRTEKYNRQGSFLPNMTGTVNGTPVTGAFVFSGTQGLQRNLWPMNYMGFQPRIGVAYAAKSWMTLRASYNILRAPLTGNGLNIWPDINLNATQISTNQGTGGVNPGPINLITNPIGPLPAAVDLPRDPIFFMNDTNSFTMYYIPQNNDVPYVQKWNFGTQIQIGTNFSIEVGYDGNKGTHLLTQIVPYNYADPRVTAPLVAAGADFNAQNASFNPLGIRNSNGQLINGTLLTSLRPYPQFFNQRFEKAYDRSGNSIYHGLHVGFQKRFSGGLNFQGNYSWSKSIDDAGSSNLQTGEVADVFGLVFPQEVDRRSQRSLSTFDIPHKFNVAYSYELPFGTGKLIGRNAGPWLNRLIGGYNLSGFFRVSAGYPLVIRMGNNGWWESRGGGNGLDGFTLRPDRVAGVDPITATWREDPFRRSYHNYLAFAVPGADGSPALGNSSPTMPDARSPRVTSADLSMFKNIHLDKEGKRYLQLRADAFNIANHPVFFANPNNRPSPYSWNATSRTFLPVTQSTPIDPNNTAQFNNYAGRAFRIGARIYF